jgi:hypothetical protein
LEIGAAPTLEIGDDRLPEGHELTRVTDVRRLSDAAIVIANSGSHELLHVDPRGTFLRAIGRRGKGPGEFLGTLHLFPGHYDSLLVFDDVNQRWTVLAAATMQGRTSEPGTEEFSRPTWTIHGAVVTDSWIGPAPHWMVDRLLRLRSDDGDYRHVRMARRDDLGYLWVRDTTPEQRWMVSGPERSNPVGVARLPDRFALMQIGSDFVLGVMHDSLDVPRVLAYSLRRPDEIRRPISDTLVAEMLVPTPDLAGRLVPVLTQVLTVQEMHYSQHRRYAESAQTLGATGIPPDARLLVVHGGEYGHSALLVDRATGFTCGMAVGQPAIPGWLDGTPVCGR